MKCYENLGFNATAGALTHDPIIKNFKMESDPLVEMKSLVVTAPRIQNNLDSAK